jgi:hypothetical protein
MLALYLLTGTHIGDGMDMQLSQNDAAAISTEILGGAVKFKVAVYAWVCVVVVVDSRISPLHTFSTE